MSAYRTSLGSPWLPSLASFGQPIKVQVVVRVIVCVLKFSMEAVPKQAGRKKRKLHREVRGVVIQMRRAMSVGLSKGGATAKLPQNSVHTLDRKFRLDIPTSGLSLTQRSKQ